MTKKEMIKKLEAEKYDIPDLNWKEFQVYYKEKMVEVSERLVLSVPTIESINEDLDRDVETGKIIKTELQLKRDELFPQIVELMTTLKNRNKATHAEIKELTRLYNEFYLRNDSASCGACIARIYKSFKEICKGRI
jgi:hypothetical protein